MEKQTINLEITIREVKRLDEVINYYLASSEERFYHNYDEEIKVLSTKIKKHLK